MVLAQGDIVRRILQNWFFKWVLAPVAVLCALGWGYFQINYPTCTFRYKLTAEVMTPDGMKTGSSVIEVSYSHYPDSGGGQSANLNMTGEADYVDLGAGKNLFVLLTNRVSGRNNQNGDTSRNFDRAKGALDAFALPIKMFGLMWKFGQEPQLCHDFAVASRIQKPEIPFGSLPTLVTFSDINNPNSVKVVQPDQFEGEFGAGYKFLKAKIESSAENPQKNIEEILPWLERKRVEWESKFGFGVGDPIVTQLFYDSFKQPYRRG